MKTLLDKATTLLDTVEPDLILGVHPSASFYSHPKVESLLAECRKQTLLEAAEDFAARGILYGYTVADQLNQKAEGEK